ncbi:gastrula zinc finger protein XlCGF57.1 [Pieris rapae]|uniref:gastrula zinc finger protein XlCGF57.1 n=1 Tax=Pieris rapae TaxID=64459 RepID=UPI001E27E939|nr:gastrula zinc finger protein XlCGF57.1 [Pieris rapae]
MDVTNMCRGCMQKVSCDEEKSTRIVEMFCYCTNISISEDENLPKRFCYECRKDIELAFTFIKKAQNVNVTLKNITSRNTSVIVPNKHKDIPMILTLPNYKLCVGVTNVNQNTIITNSSQLNNENYFEKLNEIRNDIIIEDETISNKTKEVNTDENKPHCCPVCKRSFMFKYWLSKHMEDECSGQEFVCDICNQKFIKKSKLAQHLQIHTKDCNYSCSMCGRHYKRRRYLTSHLKTHSLDRPYACEKCPKKFKLKKILISHIKTHDVVKQYLCSICGWSSNLSGNLQTHLNTHTGAKPYACRTCGFRTAAPNSLRSHELRHIQRRPYACTCGKAFYDSSALKRHSRTHTGELPYKCALCSRAFLDSWKRKTHLIRAHGLALEDIPRMRKDGATY